MRLEAAIRGDLRKVVSGEVRAARKAINAAMREAGKGLKDDLKTHTRERDLGKFVNRWTFRVNRPREPMDMSVAVFPRGKRTRTILNTFNEGGVIRPDKSRYLAIPTDFNRKGGRRGGKVLKQLDELEDSFVRRSRSGQLIVFSKVRLAQRRTEKTKQVRNLAFVEGRRLGSGRRARSEKFLRAGAVPMFVLVPRIRMAKRLDIESVVRPWRSRLPELVVANWEKEANAIRS